MHAVDVVFVLKLRRFKLGERLLKALPPLLGQSTVWPKLFESSILTSQYVFSI